MPQQAPVHLVWFKRDLRAHDHAPLWEAAQRGPVLPLYIVEPELLKAPDYDPAHWTFVQACLHDLNDRLAQLGQPLVVRVGSAPEVLQSLSRQVPIAAIWAHEETGNMLTYRRDIAVRDWARSAGVPLHELPAGGVVRRLKSRDGWANLWEQRMRAPLVATPEALQPVTLVPGRIPTHQQLKLPRDRRSTPQPGGETHGVALLNDFLANRADRYLQGLATPADAPDFSSRLSPYLAYGALSLRRVVQGTRRRLHQIERDHDLPAADRRQWLKALRAYESRLHWRDHFIQKLEDEPAIEFEHFVRALQGVREVGFKTSHFDAWRKGETGYPLVDAAMRCVLATGWLNFRMRAMLVSFAAYDLWLDWRQPALHLARAFVDYEPGIHYCQMQMQSGTTGINTMRVYDPTKQALERDPQGAFIRRWLPELAGVPELFIHTPWRMPPSVQVQAGCAIGRDYPAPIVEHGTASAAAYDRLYRARQTPQAQTEAAAVLEKHGSRRPSPKTRAGRAGQSLYQMEFGLGLDL